ncbi:MAG: succinate dehydrogenase, cytochrome b556 subunit [Pseudomonadota bacterium]
MTDSSRPLSPHLQIYRWQITMALSILHRASGVFLTMGAVVLVVWLMAAEHGPDRYAAIQAILNTLFGKLLLLAWSGALFIHLCNGVRHLFWDAGLGFEKATSRKTGWLVVVAAIVMTAVTWLVGTGVLGAGS